MKLGFDDSEEEKTAPKAFVPHMFANKNKEDLKRVAENNQNDQEESNKRRKLNDPLDVYRYNPKSKNLAASENRVPANTQFGISNSDNQVRLKESRGLVELMKACLDRERMTAITNILQ